MIDLRDPLLLLLLLLSPDVSGILLNSETVEVVDGEEAEMCFLDEAPFPLLLAAAAATGFFISFLVEVERVVAGRGEGIAAGDTDLEFVVVVSLSTIVDDEVDVDVSLAREDEAVDNDDDPELDIKKDSVDRERKIERVNP